MTFSSIMTLLSYAAITYAASLLSLLFPEIIAPIIEILDPPIAQADKFHSIACSAHSSIVRISPCQDLLLLSPDSYIVNRPDSYSINRPNSILIPNHEFDSPPSFPTHLTKYPINIYNRIWVTAPGALPSNPSKTLQYHLITYMSTKLIIGLL